MEKQTCEKCGATLTGPGASCRRCLMELAANFEPSAGAEPVTTSAPKASTPPPQPSELAPLFPELEIESLLGVGGMGAVYKARQKKLGRMVALKVLHGELSGDPMFVERFLREAQALAKLAHPGIVAVHDFGERERRCYLMMEYVDGANLRTLLKQGLLAPKQSLDIVRQLCDALQFAHDEGVVHRDIKPENVLVDLSGRVKIADFGLAKLVGVPAQASLTSAGQVMGTPHYMAPEQVEHPRDVDHRADLFSLGVVFYEMLTGELPLGRFAPPSQRVQIDVRLDEIVLKSLERERERRYQQAAEVKTDVDGLARPPAPPRRERHKLHMRSGVYLPDLRRAFARHKPTAYGWLALFHVAWIVCGFAFDAGGLWLALTGAPLLAWLYLSMLAERGGVEQQPDEQIGRWVGRLGVGAFALALLGFAALFAAYGSAWERWTWNYVSSDQQPLAGLERLRGGEPELLRSVGLGLEERGGTLDDLRLEIASAHSISNPGWCPHALVWLAIAGVLLGSAGRRVLPAAHRATLGWHRGVTGSLGVVVLSIMTVQIQTLAVSGGTQRLESIYAVETCHGDADELAERLYRELIAHELQIHAELTGRIVDRRSGAELLRVHTLAVAPASFFDRWKVSWAGPVRLEPHVLFTVASNPTGERAWIRADGGLVARDHPSLEAWQEQLHARILAACAEPESK